MDTIQQMRDRCVGVARRAERNILATDGVVACGSDVDPVLIATLRAVIEIADERKPRNFAEVGRVVMEIVNGAPSGD